MTAYVFAAGLFLIAALACVYVLLDGEARRNRASRPDLGDVLAGRVAADVPDAVDEQWTQINELFVAGPATCSPACRLPDDQAVRAAGQLPLTWRARRADIDRCYEIWHTEATR